MTFSKRNDDGFTLVELLVSIALLSLMAIYTLNAFSAMRNMNRVVDAFGEQMEVEAVQRHLRGAIGDMRPVFKNDANSQAGLLFEGEADRVAFVVASNGDREVGGLYFVQYFVNENGDLIVDRNLLRSSSSNRRCTSR